MQMLAAIYVPDFPAEAITRAEPELRAQAVAVMEGTPPLLHVIAGNRHARAAGVEIGMTQLEAEGRIESRVASCELRVRNWQIRRRAPAQEQAAHAALVDCACAFSPRVEASASTPDTVVLDLDGLERLFGPPLKIARTLARRAAQLGLEVHVAVAGNADAAVHAARGFAGITVIPPGEEAVRLGALPVELLLSCELRVANCESRTGHSLVTRDSQLAATLARWGIHTFRALAALPETAVRLRLGEAGVRLQKLARGEGSHPLVPAAPPLKFEEALELEYPITLLEPLAFLLNTMLEQLCARLAARALATQEVRLSLGPENEYVLRLPVPMVDAKVFLKLLHLDLCSRPPNAPVEKISLAAEPILPRFTQGGLFLPATPEPEKLEVMLARIRKTVASRESRVASKPGAPPISRLPSPVSRSKDVARTPVASQSEEAESQFVGTAELLDTHRPDAFRVNPIFRSVAPAKPNVSEITERETRNGKRETVLRRYRPPRPVRVEVKEGQPVTISDFRATVDTARPGGRQTSRTPGTRNVLWAAGPWRESGEWWTEASWSRETWDIALREDGNIVIVRAFRDIARNRWFVEALYD